MKQPTAIYPGTFDPITYGHIDVVERASRLFPRVIVLVARNTSKNPLFTAEERVTMIRRVFRGKPRIDVDAFDGLLVEYMRRRKAGVIIRALLLKPLGRRCKRHCAGLLQLPGSLCEHAGHSSFSASNDRTVGGTNSDTSPPRRATSRTIVEFK